MYANMLKKNAKLVKTFKICEKMQNKNLYLKSPYYKMYLYITLLYFTTSMMDMQIL